MARRATPAATVVLRKPAPKARQRTRRELTTEAYATRSTRLRSSAGALTAASEVLDTAPSAKGAAAQNSASHTWQMAAWQFAHQVPELNAAKMYVGNCLSRVALRVGKRNPDGSVNEAFDGAEPVDGMDPAIAAEAAEIVSSIRSEIGGQSELNRSYGEKMFICGELYVVPEDTPAGLAFEVLSTQELIREGSGYVRNNGPGYGNEPLPEGVVPIRVWRRDGQWSRLASSSVQACLEVCLAEGTLISTDQGPVPIERVEVGDVVWSWDAGELVQRPVTRVMDQGTQDVYRVRTTHRSIRATGAHRFLRISRDGPGWATVGDLVRGDILVASTGLLRDDDEQASEEPAGDPEYFTPVTVLGVEPDGEAHTWDLEIDGTHNFIADGLVSHNCEELVILTRLVRSSAISRMALAGILCIADEFDTVEPGGTDADGQTAESTNPLAVDIINTGAKAIDDPASAAAWMPYILQGPMELINTGVRHIALQNDGPDHVLKRREALERLAQGLDLPVEVVVGFGGTTFANASVIDESTFSVHIEPTVQMWCDALTINVLWPAMARKRGIAPDRIAEVGYPPEILTVAVHYDASALISRPDMAKDILEAFKGDPSQTAIRIAELRMALGLSADECPDDAEVARRIDAIRLTKIREVIAAPADDAAVPIANADQAPIPGQSAGNDLIGKVTPTSSPAQADAAAASPADAAAEKAALQQANVTAAALALANRVAGAAEVTIERAADKLGARLRSKVRGAEREAVAGVPNAEVAAILGPTAVARVLGDDDPVAAELATFARTVARWAAAGGHPHPGQVAQEASVLVADVARDRLYGPSVDVTPELCASLVAGVR